MNLGWDNMDEESIWKYINAYTISKSEIKREKELVKLLKTLCEYGAKLPKELSFKLNLHTFERGFFQDYNAKISFFIGNEQGDSIGLFKVMFRLGSLFPTHIGFYDEKIPCDGMKELENQLKKLFATEFKTTIEQFIEI